MGSSWKACVAGATFALAAVAVPSVGALNWPWLNSLYKGTYLREVAEDRIPYVEAKGSPIGRDYYAVGKSGKTYLAARYTHVPGISKARLELNDEEGNIWRPLEVEVYAVIPDTGPQSEYGDEYTPDLRAFFRSITVRSRTTELWRFELFTHDGVGDLMVLVANGKKLAPPEKASVQDAMKVVADAVEKGVADLGLQPRAVR